MFADDECRSVIYVRKYRFIVEAWRQAIPVGRSGIIGLNDSPFVREQG
jgi:hypothetical protein